MSESPHAWWDFGYAGIFACVFLEQIGVPIPAFPALLAAGALITAGELHLSLCLVVAVAAALLADTIWYGVGRIRGDRVLSLMCRLSWKPDSCVTKTKIVYSKGGINILLFAKFIPALSTLAPPLAGMAQVRFSRFLLYDSLGALVWAMVPLAIGSYLQQSFTTLQTRAHSLVPYLPWICGSLVIAVLIWRYINRRRYRKALQESLNNAISPVELKSLVDQDESVVILDVRDEITAKANPVTLPKARWIPYGSLAKKIGELSLDKPIVVYCECPEDQGAVAMVDLLRRHGAAEARPLRGGLKGWINDGFEILKLNLSA